jgi:ankyrin repeat protein
MNRRNFDIILKHNGYDFKSQSINALDRTIGLTRLIHAIRLGYVEMVQLMIDEGADIEETGRGSKTPLMYAIESNNIPASKLLIKSGANVNAVDDNGMSVRHYAKRNGSNLIITKTYI